MTRLTARRFGAACLAALALGATACSSDDEAAPATTTEAADETTTTKADATTTTTEAPADDAAASDGALPSWARPYEITGDLLTTIEGTNFKVDVYQVGTAAAPKDGMFVDPDTNESILKAGDPLVYVNYVITNTGGADIPLTVSLVDVNAEYSDWKWMQGMDSSSDSSLYESMKVNSVGLATGQGDAPYLWKAGETFAYGDNFAHQPGSEIVFEARLTPSLPDGSLDHDKREVVEATTTIR